MANELALHYMAGQTPYAIVWAPDRRKRWDGTSMVLATSIADTDVAWQTGAVPLTELLLAATGSGTGQYVGDMPSTELLGTHQIDFYDGLPARGDRRIGFQSVDMETLVDQSSVTTTRVLRLTVRRDWEVDGVLTDPTSIVLSDPTGTYGVKESVAGTVTIADGTAMDKLSTGKYEYSFVADYGTAYTAWVEIVYGGNTYRYEHDFEVVSDTEDPGMLVSYTSLLKRVGHHLFGIRDGFSTDQTDDIEECITDGLHDVYTAHPWSFFRPIKEITTTAPYTTGTITVASGVVSLTDGTFPSWAAVGVIELDDVYYDVDTRDGDTQVTLEDTSVTDAADSAYVLGRPEYDLPTTCEAIEGDLVYEPGQSDLYPPIRQKHDGEIRRLRQDDPYNSQPLYYGIRTVEFDPTVGSRRRLSLYPTPDAAYVFKMRMKLRATMIDSTNKYPVGGETLAQVITEACLAAAERNYDFQERQHTKRFEELLPLAIAADQEITSPTHLGPDSPAGDNSDTYSRQTLMGDISLGGVTL